MSNSDYIAKLDKYQLEDLIEQATDRLTDIRQSGWVRLWTVSINDINIAWFPEDKHSAAVEFACKEVWRAVDERPDKCVEMEVSLEHYRPNKAADLLRQANSAKDQL